MTSKRTHAAVVTTAIRAPLAIHQVPTNSPTANEVPIRVEWTASTPLNLHQNIGGLLVQHPQVLGTSMAGNTLKVGPQVMKVKVGDKGFGYTWRSQQEKAHQEYVTAPENMMGVVPEDMRIEEAVAVPNNFVSVFHAVTANLGIRLPWPKTDDYTPEKAEASILIWGGSSSVGQYALQVLRHCGYRNLIATASPQHHALLKSLGAKAVFSYRDADVVAQIRGDVPAGVEHILDCIGSLRGSVVPITEIAQAGSTVAVLLPIIVQDATVQTSPEYAMDATQAPATIGAPWAEGVHASGVRTQLYLENSLFAERLQSEIMPGALSEGWVKPNSVQIVEGDTLLERAQKAVDMLREKAVSAEHLVWRISE